MLDAVIKAIDNLDLEDQEKVRAVEYFDGIRDRKPALFKKEQVQEKTEVVTTSVN
jgi:hypothetical protein